ncbi:peptidoglycan recognition protein family protein [Paenibacillus tuaregi]|uniref:peptidoglycan recognition protein family protein n=1 Tax=Paenibacillus tuaregi TaxID=1816681 RepID=UPI00083989C2|nr:peptidoglycan recognition family protein [Paenibacillus tuaregi]
MKQKGNFLLMKPSEFRGWLSKQKVIRNISRLQVHHTASPNYSTRGIREGAARQDYFVCLEGMRNYHIQTQGWSATGQNITTFEDGTIAISLDRDLNHTPAGIKGANTGAICIENIGSFDRGGDLITEEQRKSILHLYACLAEKFNIPVDTDHIVYHAWYTRSGERMADYTPGRSSKTCPGTNFWGDGNTVLAANRNFIPQIAAELARLKNKKPTPDQISNINDNSINKEDEPMTPTEKKMMDELKAQVNGLLKAQSMDVPSYAKPAIDKLTQMKDRNGHPIIDTPDGRSADFYALATVLDRLGMLDR